MFNLIIIERVALILFVQRILTTGFTYKARFILSNVITRKCYRNNASRISLQLLSRNYSLLSECLLLQVSFKINNR